jgi:hypothetical protein
MVVPTPPVSKATNARAVLVMGNPPWLPYGKSSSDAVIVELKTSIELIQINWCKACDEDAQDRA